jgi:tight adherence protein C
MNITVIFGAISMVGAVAAFWWGMTSRPSKARANLFAGLPQAAAPAGSSDTLIRRLGTASRKVIPGRLVDGLEVKLVQAGHPYGLDLARLLGIKLVLSLTTFFLLILVGQPVFGVILAIALFFLPDYWVMTVREKRQDAIRSQAPDVIDQLTICVEAGLGFDAALTRVSHTSEGPLAEELRRTMSDMSAGVPRAQALRVMGDRVQIPEIRQLVTALLQAQKHGVPLAETLRIQSAEMRTKKKQYTEEKAAKLTVKMIFPIIFCFMPVFMIVSVLPTILNMIKHW